jgi:cytochrome c-type biogenesis protein CcmH
VKYVKALVVTASALGLSTVAAVLLRPDDTPVPPSRWIQDAAVAFNSAPIAADPNAVSLGVTRIASDARPAALEGQRLRVQRRFAEAAASFQRAVEADPMDADAWADLADSSAAAAGKDLTVGREAILRALAIDPRHRKALWLRASLELQEGRYVDAAATWRELQLLVPVGSGDARVIAANIAEADALAGPKAVLAGRGS